MVFAVLRQLWERWGFIKERSMHSRWGRALKCIRFYHLHVFYFTWLITKQFGESVTACDRCRVCSPLSFEWRRIVRYSYVTSAQHRPYCIINLNSETRHPHVYHLMYFHCDFLTCLNSDEFVAKTWRTSLSFALRCNKSCKA